MSSEIVSSGKKYGMMELYKTAKQEERNCPKHGDYTATVLITGWSTACPACDEIDRNAQMAAEREERQAEEKKKNLERRLGRSGIPLRFQSKTFEGYSAENSGQKKALATCMAYADNFDDNYKTGRSLLLLGKAGTGKTHLAAAIAMQVIRQSEMHAAYITLHDMLADIRATYDGNSERTEADVMSVFGDFDLLIIDEIGSTKSSEFELATLFRVINSRYENMMPTIVVSNLSPQQLPDAMGDRCVDRLREDGGIALVFDWQSNRSKRG